PLAPLLFIVASLGVALNQLAVNPRDSAMGLGLLLLAFPYTFCPQGPERLERMPIIDFHNHYYPPEYIKAIEQGPSAVRITYDEQKNPRLHYPGDYNIAVRGHRDIDYRIDVMDEQGIDTDVITLTTPGTHIE